MPVTMQPYNAYGSLPKPVTMNLMQNENVKQSELNTDEEIVPVEESDEEPMGKPKEPDAFKSHDDVPPHESKLPALLPKIE